MDILVGILATLLVISTVVSSRITRHVDKRAEEIRNVIDRNRTLECALKAADNRIKMFTVLMMQAEAAETDKFMVKFSPDVLNENYKMHTAIGMVLNESTHGTDWTVGKFIKRTKEQQEKH